MRLLINASIFDGKKNGLGIYTKEVINAINRKKSRDFEITVFSFSPLENDNINQCEISYGLFQKVISMGSVAIYRLIWNIFVLPFIASRYDLVYSVSPHGSVFIKKKQIITVHDLIGLDKKISSSQALYYRTILPLILKKSKRIICISNATKDDLIRNVKGIVKRVVVIYNGADHLKQLPSLPSHLPSSDVEVRDYFLLVGASFPHKNVERVISVFSIIKECKLIIVHSMNNYSKALLSKYSEIKNVIFVSELSDEDLVSLYRNALGNIYVSLKEGFGFPPFEAALNNTVSIVSEIDSLKEIYGESSVIYVNPYSIEDIKMKVLELVAGRYDCDFLLEIAKKRLSEFTWERTASNLLTLFNEVKN